MTIANAGRVVLWVVAAVLLFMAAYLGLNRLRADPVVLQTYAVPPEIAEEVRSALSDALWRGQKDPPIGQVTLMPNGSLVVTAPASVQEGVGRIIHDIKENRPGPTPSIRFDLWVVAASPGEGTQASGALEEVVPAQATALESSDPRVQFYWVQPAGAP